MEMTIPPKPTLRVCPEVEGFIFSPPNCPYSLQTVGLKVGPADHPQTQKLGVEFRDFIAVCRSNFTSVECNN